MYFNLSDAIAQWCKQDGHSAQLQAWRHLLSGLSKLCYNRRLNQESFLIERSRYLHVS
ncbi:hypothetical protein [Coleofasciculus chthonoplastes]|uniref:hypothetical protein n=1 Tax=Coleofasciculus TaxID=669368 RepID=UPI0032F69A30